MVVNWCRAPPPFAAMLKICVSFTTFPVLGHP